jgi:hypothetical protein
MGHKRIYIEFYGQLCRISPEGLIAWCEQAIKTASSGDFKMPSKFGGKEHRAKKPPTGVYTPEPTKSGSSRPPGSSSSDVVVLNLTDWVPEDLTLIIRQVKAYKEGKLPFNQIGR